MRDGILLPRRSRMDTPSVRESDLESINATIYTHNARLRELEGRLLVLLARVYGPVPGELSAGKVEFAKDTPAIESIRSSLREQQELIENLISHEGVLENL
jgi:hypothetical protein